MRLTAFQSDKGDCLLLTDTAGARHILVDGGMPVSYKAHVAAALHDGENVEWYSTTGGCRTGGGSPLPSDCRKGSSFGQPVSRTAKQPDRAASAWNACVSAGPVVQ